MIKTVFTIVLSLLIYAILLLPSWYPETAVFKAGKFIKGLNPMYAWADWWGCIGTILLLLAGMAYIDQLIGKLYDYIRELED